MTLTPVGPTQHLPSPFAAGQMSSDQVAAGFLLGYADRTRSAYGRDLADWFGFCRSLGVDPLAGTRTHVDAYARHLGEVEHRSPATVARRLSALSGFYRWAVDEDVIGRNPVASVRRPKVGTDTVSTGLDREELSALIAAAASDGVRSHALVLLLALNGLRVSEALQADVGDLSTERGHRVLKIVRKGGKRSTAPLAPRTAEAVDALVDGRSDGPLFVTSTGARLDRTGAWRIVRKLGRRAVPAKADTLHPHDLRHAFVTLSLDTGTSLRDVQDGPATRPRERFQIESMTWQSASQVGSWAAMRSWIDEPASKKGLRRDPNRIVEIQRIMGAIGEQVSLCWTIEQDAQRFRKAKGLRDEHDRLILRALAESGGHFLLGAAHSLGNLGIRAALLDPDAGPIVKGKGKVNFEPGSDDPNAWKSLSVAVGVLETASVKSPNAPLKRITTSLAKLWADPAFKALNTRRGMDYHRVRPQSVPHSSPKAGTLTSASGTLSLVIPGPSLDPDSDAGQVYRTLVAAMESVRKTMRTMRIELPKAIRAAKIWYHEEAKPPQRSRPAAKARRS
jgi:integrase/recombinase XerD